MTRLALAIGFLSVFGLVAFALINYLDGYFRAKRDSLKKPEEKSTNHPTL